MKPCRMLNEKRIHRLVVVEKENGHIRPVGILSVTIWRNTWQKLQDRKNQKLLVHCLIEISLDAQHEAINLPIVADLPTEKGALAADAKRLRSNVCDCGHPNGASETE